MFPKEEIILASPVQNEMIMETNRPFCRTQFSNVHPIGEIGDFEFFRVISP